MKSPSALWTFADIKDAAIKYDKVGVVASKFDHGIDIWLEGRTSKPNDTGIQ
jgi:hypothetical protein